MVGTVMDVLIAGKIEPMEVKNALAKLGLNIDLAEAENLTRRLV